MIKGKRVTNSISAQIFKWMRHASCTINRSRFQIEFLYRDAKQHTGLNHCQARSENKLHFQFNAALSTINIAKAVHWISIPKEQRKAFLMNDIKTMNHKALLLESFFTMFGLNPHLTKNQKHVKELIYYGTIAA